ncbi:laccase-like multicopper oxidase 1 [Anopheles darlingi]|uniref:Laccase-like multicopper oxidase 1 n=1 Tax=Anopheles darlingi TaxID=43151 RepID=W5JD72_ANODA|nr:laccase-like multicopper oxidase 1 [Anopheles darlingi]
MNPRAEKPANQQAQQAVHSTNGAAIHAIALEGSLNVPPPEGSISLKFDQFLHHHTGHGAHRPWPNARAQAEPPQEAFHDQSAASSWWNSHLSEPPTKNFYQATHGLLQTHPSGSLKPASPSALPLSAGRPSSPIVASPSAGSLNSGFPSIANPNPRSPFRHLDFSTSATAELRRNPSLSAPDECARACREGEPPRICYYHFTVEYYTVLGAACQVCTPNATNTVWSHCQCVLADGVERGILTVNRMIPGPSIQVCENDRVVIDVENHMEGMELTIHWHGIWQRGTQYYDGVPFVTQCPIQQGNTFRASTTAVFAFAYPCSSYQWTGNAGTHFWHAHTGLQKLDGLYGSIVVRQPPSRDPNSHLYDFDLTTHIMLVSDWLHEDAAERYPGRLAVNTGQDPESLLINGKGQFRDPNTGFMTNTPLEIFTITPGRRYRFRMINAFASVCPAQVTIEGHGLTVIATDGEPVHPVQVNTIISFSGTSTVHRVACVCQGCCPKSITEHLASPLADVATLLHLDANRAATKKKKDADKKGSERYDFVITADQPVGAYWIQLRGLGECGIKRAQQLAILRYARGPYQPASPPPTYDVGLPQGVVMNPLDAQCNVQRDDAICVSQLKNAKEIDRALLQEKPDVKIFLPFRFYLYRPEELFQPNTYNRFLVAPTGDHVISLIDEISYLSAPAPLLSQFDDINPEQFCNGDNRPADCGANCMCTHKVDIPLNAIVEVVLVDEVQQPNLSHPFHLHGYAYNVIGIGRSPDSNVKKINLKHALDLDRRGLLHRQYNLPPLKDTIAVPNNGYVVLRFRADNPGMNLILQVGTLADLPPVPPNFPTCGDHLPPIN